MTRPLSRRSHTPVVRAKADFGNCEFCGGALKRGQYIAKVMPNDKWGHADCAKGYCRTINEHLEESAA
ncbi:MAG TPA: hypothetical protein VFN92_08150 [Solirubrobacterales bacterium]|nr:hypothetical protein [Solirubrobacterales bacterium]